MSLYVGRELAERKKKKKKEEEKRERKKETNVTKRRCRNLARKVHDSRLGM